MNATKIVAILLIIAGIAGLVYGSVVYRTETHRANVGPLDFSVTEKHRVNIPVWVGAGAIVIGAALLLIPRKKL